MNHDSYDDSYIRGILNTVKTIAMVGVSAEGQPAELFRVQISARARLSHDPGQSGPGRQGAARPEGLCQARRHSRADRHGRYLPRLATTRSAIVEEALALKPRPQVIWMQLGVRNDEAAALAEASGHQGGDEPLPEDRIRPAVVGDRLDGRQFAHPDRPSSAQDARQGHPAHVARSRNAAAAARPMRPIARARAGNATDRLRRSMPLAHIALCRT